ncbi:sensor histidine kinase [Streptomyces qinzhouensis]|uniref:histidine kinase n=1 Tax=Streptomyces qinzhouensis TaxID=2599401 RepID=A0A5B8JGR1_9ACTN|nr:histidine kinase [Streptomyces qinzhouensis]QDY79051.1 two-component sensor histidine kinase [Streptomyces qinzhouensis]
MRLPRPHRDDVLIVSAALIGGILLWSLGLYMQSPESSPTPPWAALVPLVVICCQSAFRRSRPMLTLLVGCLALIADLFTVGSLVTIVVFTDTVYASVVYGPTRYTRHIPKITGVLTVAVTLVLLAVLRDAESILLGIVVGLITFAPAATGAIVRNHREAADAARLRAEQTALLAEMDRAQAVTAERSRMARELHDLVANHLSAIAIHSTAAISLDDPKTTRGALEVIRENSVDGLTEMRRLIGLLRDNSDDWEPAARPSLSGIESLVAQARTNGAASGIDCVLDDRRPGVREGRPATAVPPAPVEQAAYRIVQESLTNALKHAAPGRVLIVLEHTAGHSLTVVVTSPYGARSGPRAPGSGAGLVGMRERVALLGGEFEAGPEPGPAAGPEKIWRVRAVLPVHDDKEPDA